MIVSTANLGISPDTTTSDNPVIEEGMHETDSRSANKVDCDVQMI